MLTLVLGGARSGKSRYALSLCAHAPTVVFVATASVKEADSEMTARIARHREGRPRSWTTIEAPLEVPAALESTAPGAVVVVDCITLWLSNLLYAWRDLEPEERERRVLSEVARVVEACRERDVIAVSNEVGAGIVPMNPVGRVFRDLSGLVNQRLAAGAERVVLVVAGLPLWLKG